MESWIAPVLPEAVAYATSLVGNRALGEDLVQDCACRLLARAGHYDLPRDGRRLLFRAVTNACINHATRKRPTVSLDSGGRDESPCGWEIVDAETPTPPEAAMAAELRQAIADGLQQLNVRHRSALELASLGYATEEIAEMLNVRAENVRVMLFRARKAMSTYLNARYFGGVKP